MALTTLMKQLDPGSISAWAIFALLLPLAITSLISRHTAREDQLPLPPSPPRTDLISGHLSQVLRAAKGFRQHLLFHDWAKKYGEVYFVRLGPFQEYFINSDRAVKEIFDKASAQTSERPRWIVSNELMTNKMNLLLLNASDKTWRHQRKVTTSGLTSVPSADAGLPFLHFETLKFLNELASDPERGADSRAIYTSIGRYTYSTFASQTFGLDVPTVDNPAIDYTFETGIAQIQGMLPGSYMVDTFPFLEFLPSFLKPWEKEAKARFARDYAWCGEKVARIQKLEPAEGSPLRSSLIRRVMDDPKRMGFYSLGDAAYLCLMLVIGGADTSRISTWSFLEAMLMFPEVCNKARKLLDEAVGDRVPLFEDVEQVPYIRYMMKEVWRWRPPVAIGHPHMTTGDVLYGGYRIPKGSRIHLNTWAIHHDPTRYENPEQFIPERYEGDLTTAQQSSASHDVSKRDHFAFGSGRRICPGYHVAERSFAVAIMRLLWAFEISVRPGTPLPLDPRNYADDFPGNAGKDLPVVLTVRSPDRLATIQKAYQDAVRSRPEMEPLV